MKMRTMPTFCSIHTYNNQRLITTVFDNYSHFLFLISLDEQKRPITIMKLALLPYCQSIYAFSRYKGNTVSAFLPSDANPDLSQATEKQ